MKSSATIRLRSSKKILDCSVNVSIVIPVYNEEKRIGRCLNSILKQDFDGCYEVIIVDNGCTDKTIDIVSNFDFTFVVEDSGLLGSARQTGIENSKGKYIAFLDADAVAEPTWLSTLYESREKADVIIGSIQPYNVRTPIESYFQAIHELDKRFYAKRIHRRNLKMFGTGNLFMRRDIALKIGFDRNLPTSEDGDFSYRLISSGFTVMYNGGAIVYHEIPNSISCFFKYHRKLATGSFLLFKKYRNREMVKSFLLNMFYPISPIYLQRMKFVDISEHLYILLGIIRFYANLITLIERILIPLNLGKRVLRPKHSSDAN